MALCMWCVCLYVSNLDFEDDAPVVISWRHACAYVSYWHELCACASGRDPGMARNQCNCYQLSRAVSMHMTGTLQN